MTIEIREMSEQEVKDMCSEFDLIAVMHGFKDYYEFADSRHSAAEGMIKFGGSFTHMLGHALARADSANSFKIYKAFREMWDEHRELWIKSEALREQRNG